MKKGIMGKWLCLLMAASMLAFSLGGCGGSDDDNNVIKANYKEVVELASPVFQIGETYTLYRGGSLEDPGIRNYVAPVGSSDNQAIIYLGLEERLSGDVLIFTDSQDRIVFAYNPAGTEDDDTTPLGDVEAVYLGEQQKYTSLELRSRDATVNSFSQDDLADAHVIQLSSDGTATLDGTAVSTFDYVWYASPDVTEPYYTLGRNSTTHLTADFVSDAIASANANVYIARDIRYMPNYLNFTGTAKNDNETEYASYYTDSATEDLDYTGPYIFATLPNTMGGGGAPDGAAPDGGNGNTPPGENGNGTNPPGGNGNGETPPAPPNAARTALDNSSVTAYSTMTHSPSEAYANPVLHITDPGTYILQGRWNGQIWIGPRPDGKSRKNDETAIFNIVLNGVTVSCDVAPALVFHKVYECGPDNEDKGTVVSRDTGDYTSFDVGDFVAENAGAVVIISDDTTNNFTGSNVYRMLTTDLKTSSGATDITGDDVSQQKKLWKMDGAFYSFVSMVIDGLSKKNGVLNVTSTTYEGLDTEMHLTVNGGVINITAPDDAINVNEDYVSVMTVNGGTMTIVSSGGDGIDSNGYIVIKGGTLDITAGSGTDIANGEGTMDAELGTYVSSAATVTRHAANGSTNGGPGGENGNGGNGEDNSGDEGNTSEPVTVLDEYTTSTEYGYTTFSLLSGDVTVPATSQSRSDSFPTTSDRFMLEIDVNVFSGIRDAD